MKKQSPKLFNLATATSPHSIVVASNVQTYTFYGNLTLSAPFAIQATGTPIEGMECFMVFTGAVTPASNAFSIFGTAINPKVIVNPWLAWCKYTNSAWIIVYWNFASKGADGIGVTVDANGNFAITPLGIVNSMIATNAAIAWSKIVKDIVNADVNASAAIAVSKLAAATPSQLAAFDGSGFLQSLAVATYPSLTELSYLKGATSAVQTQLAAIVATFSSYATTAAVAAALTAYYTSGQTDSAIAAAITALTSIPIKNAILTGATVLDGTAKSQYTLNTSGGTIALTLPLAASFPNGTIITISIYGANSTGSTIVTQGSNILYDILGATPASLTGMATGSWYDIMGNGAAGAAGKWRVVRGVTL